MKTSLVLFLCFWTLTMKGQHSNPSQRVNNLLHEMYLSDAAFRKLVDDFSFDDCRSQYNDSLLVGKFPLVLSKGGKAWFDKFSALRNRVKFSRPINERIIDLDKYYASEIKHLDYDSIATGGYFQGNDTLFGQLIEGYLFEWYKFYKAGKEIKFITLSFLGGRQLTHWSDEANSRQTYTFRIQLSEK